MLPATRKTTPLRSLVHHGLVLFGSLGLTFAFFLVLPLIQAISDRSNDDSLVRTVDTVQLPPPPVPPEPEQKKEEEPEEEPPKLEQDMPQLDLSQLEVALNPGMTGGFMGGGAGIDLGDLGAGNAAAGGAFSFADLDQKPRATFQPSPVLTGPLRRKAPGKVIILFEVDERGRVAKARVKDTTDPVFTGPALAALRKWRYEPGKRNGKPVRFRLKQTISFPKTGRP